VDLLLRTTTPRAQAPNAVVPRDEVTRVMLNAVRQGGSRPTTEIISRTSSPPKPGLASRTPSAASMM
jgi:hypothetical protein